GEDAVRRQRQAGRKRAGSDGERSRADGAGLGEGLAEWRSGRAAGDRRIDDRDDVAADRECRLSGRKRWRVRRTGEVGDGWEEADRRTVRRKSRTGNRYGRA